MGGGGIMEMPINLDLTVNGLSYHIGQEAREAGLNETNPGYGVRISDNGNYSIQVGEYKNSGNKQTVYSTLQYQVKSFGLMFGAATGYEQSVVAAIFMSHEYKNVRYNVYLTPPVGESVPPIVMFNVDYRLTGK